MKILLLPGLDGSGILFEPLAKVLAELNCDYAIEPINNHKSNHHYMAHLECHYRHEDIILVGESYSSHIATRLALKGNLTIKGIVIVAGFLTNPSWLTYPALKLPVKMIIHPPLPKALLARALFSDKADDHRLLALFNRAITSVDPQVIKQRIRDIIKLEHPKASSEIPCLYIKALKDKLVAKNSYRNFESIFSHCEIKEIATSHFVAQTHAQDCAEYIQQFTEKLK